MERVNKMTVDCTIICGAPCAALDKNLISGFVIAADKGLDYALKAGIVPHLCVGDFDSAGCTVPENIDCIRAVPEKDDTDAILAANIAVERGFKQLRFLCALGGRLGHTLANIQMLYGLKKRGIDAEMYGEHERVELMLNETKKFARFNGYLSVFAYENTAEITERGVKYQTENRVFTSDYPLGVSNEITEEFAEITVKGCAVIVEEYGG